MFPMANGLMIALGTGDELDAAVTNARRKAQAPRTATEQPSPSPSEISPVSEQDAADPQLARIEEGKVNAWVQGVGTRGERNTGYGHDDYTYDTAGVIGGLDFRIGERWLLGAMGGWARTDLDWVGRGGSGQADVGQIGAYAAFHHRGWFADGVFGYGLNWFDTRRDIKFEGLDRTAVSDHKGSQLILRAGGGRLFDVGRGLGLEPTLDVQWLRVDQDPISETGAGDVSLEIAGRQVDSLRTALGLRMFRRFDLGKRVSLLPEVWGGWSHEFLDKNRTEVARYIGQTESFLVQGTRTARDGGVVDAGLSLFLGDQLSLRAGYIGQFRSSDTVHSLTFGLRMRFPRDRR